jgi:hypothetical protein
MAYCTIDDLRDEGFPACDFSDRRVQRAIDLACDIIDRATGRFFVPRDLVIDVNWRGQPELLLEQPIIRVDKIVWVNTDGSESTPPLDLRDRIIFNRHVSQGLTEPDDREDPKVSWQFISPGSLVPRPRPLRPRLVQSILTRRAQNVRITGKFGYTDPDFGAGRSIASAAGDAITAPDTIKMDNGAFTSEDVGRTITIAGSGAGNNATRTIAAVPSSDTVQTVEQDLTSEGTGFTATVSAFPQFGKTPRLIEDICLKIAARHLNPLAGGDPVENAMNSGRILKMTVRDQSISFLPDPRAAGGDTALSGDAAITGDPEIDLVLAQFRRPPRLGVA